MITKTYDNITEEEVYKLYFRLINAMLPNKKLTEKRINLITEFLLIKGDKFKHSRFSAKAKDIVRERLKEKYNWTLSKPSLIVALLHFEELGYIEKDEDGIKYFSKTHQKVLDKIKESNDFTEITFKIRMNKQENK